MRKLLGLVVALALVSVLAWLLSRREVAPAVTSVPTAEPAVVVDKVELEPVVLETPVAPVESGSPARAPAAIIPPAGAAPARPELTEIRGRFLLASQEPALGVRLALSGYQANDERARRYGIPDNWKDVAITNDNDGRFSIRFDPPRAFQFYLEAVSKGHCQTKWHWGEIEPHSVVDVGDVTLVRGGSIRARIVDKKGRVLNKGWRVHAEGELRDRSNGRDETRVVAYFSRSNGGYLLTGLPPGRAHLSAYSEIANWIEGPTVEVIENQETAADILYDAPDVESRISVSVSTMPFYIFEFDDNFEFVIRGAGIEERKAEKVEGSSQLFSFPDLPAGLYHIELRDERFQPWSRSDVKPGTAVDARLNGNASAVLIVTDAATRAPVSSYALDVRFDESRSSPNTFRILETKNEPPPEGRFKGLIPTTQTLIVRADGYSACELSVRDLKPNEKRTLVALLTRSSALKGRVVSGSGATPIGGVAVTLVPVRSEANEQVIRRGEHDPDAYAQETDADGRFEFGGVSGGNYRLTASMNRFFRTETELFVGPSSATQEVELALPARSWLLGRLLAPAGTSFAEMFVVAVPADVLARDPLAEKKGRWSHKDDAAAVISADGSFRLGPVPPGEVSLWVRMPDSPSRSSTLHGRSIEVGRVDLPANVETAHEFDFRLLAPGTFEIEATVDGRPASAFSVKFNDAQAGLTSARLQLDVQGRGRSKPILPGSYDITIYPEKSSIPSATNVRRELAPGETVKVVLQLRHVAGVVRVLDEATGKALAGQRVTVAPDTGEFTFGSSFDCAADGSVKLEVPVGRYRMAIATDHNRIAPDAGVVLEWSEQGPSPAEVRLKPK